MAIEVYNKIGGVDVKMCKARIDTFIEYLLYFLLSKVDCSEVKMSAMRRIKLMQRKWFQDK